jgi:O-acetyl-ADP-ribose deacetylase (regulator of RNase III)
VIETLERLLGGRLVVARGDLTEFHGDAIVNAANSGLLGGGGVDGAIHRAAGPELLEECRRLRRDSYPAGLPAGEAAMTGAGALSLRAVIHTVGPIWEGGGAGEPELLASAYRNSLTLASGAGFESLAFPAISTGVYGYPKAEAAKVAFGTIEAFLGREELPKAVWLVFYSEADARLFLETVK